MRSVLVVAVAVLLGCWVSPALAQAQQAGVEIENADDVLVVGATGARVTLFNTSAVATPVRASVTARTRDGQVAGLAVTPPRSSLAPTGDLELRVTRTSLSDLWESASGWLVVVAGEGQEQTVLRRPVRVVVPSGTPGATTWRVEWSPWPTTRSGSLDGAIPVTGGGCAGVAVRYPDRPVLTNGNDSGRLALGCRGRAIVLRAEDFPAWGHGDYTGTIAVGDTSVEVTVRRTVPVWIAGGLLLGGLLVALLVQGWAGDRRDLHLRRSRFATLKKDASKLTGLARPMANSVGALRTRLESLACKGPRGWLPWPEGHNATEFATLDGEVEKLTALVDAWPEFSTARKTITIPADRTWAPKLVASLERLTTTLADSTDGLTTQVAEVAAAADALAVVAVTVETDARIAAAEAADDPRVRRLAGRARLRHNVLRAQLARVASSTETSALAPAIARVLVLADQLPPPGPLPGRARVAGADDDAPLTMTPVAELLDRLRAWGQDVIDTTAARGSTMVIRDAGVAVLLAVVGVWSGLALLYFDKPWGSVNDMIAAAVWGFATPVIVAPVLGAVRRIGSRVNSGEGGTADGDSGR